MNVGFEYDALPANGTAPTSLSLHAGGSVDPLVTVTVTAADVVDNPALSVATAVSEYVPAGTLFHANVYGAAVSVASSVDPE